MLAIRLSRIGKKNSPFFRIVVMDKQKSAKGRALEVLGSVNPHKKEIVLKNERILYWIGVGAEASDRVHNILVSKNVIKGPKKSKKIRAKKSEEKESESAPVAATPAATPVADAPVAEEQKEETGKPEEKTEEPKIEELKEEKSIDPSTSPSTDSGFAQDDSKKVEEKIKPEKAKREEKPVKTEKKPEKIKEEKK
ncbi:MAG: 30S ribosomal protein S16 [Candidatus Moraniibacteriota bacterium]